MRSQARIAPQPEDLNGRAKMRGHVYILIARDDCDRTHDEVVGFDAVRTVGLLRHLTPIADPNSVLIASITQPTDPLARTSAKGRHDADQPPYSAPLSQNALHNVIGYRRRFRQWLAHFLGVATRYLANYLGWHWAVDNARISTPEEMLRAALTPPPPHT